MFAGTLRWIGHVFKSVAKAKMAKKKKPANQSEDKPSFEDALKELEETVRLIEDGQLGLDASLARYEEGVKHLERCHELLKRAETSSLPDRLRTVARTARRDNRGKC